jgi:hypothetical protein
VIHHNLFLLSYNLKNGLFSSFQRIATDLWYLAVALDKCPHTLLEFLKFELTKDKCHLGTPLSRYLSRHQFQEIHLDGIFKFYDRSSLPLEVRYWVIEIVVVTYLFTSFYYHYFSIPPLMFTL